MREDHNHVVGYSHHFSESEWPVIQVLKDVAGKGATELFISKWQGLLFDIELEEMWHSIRSNIDITQDSTVLSYYLSLVRPVRTAAYVYYALTIAKTLGILKGRILGGRHVKNIRQGIGRHCSLR